MTAGRWNFTFDVHRSYIHHNYSYNTQGFTEIGGGNAYDNVIAYNLMVESGRPLGLHLGGERNGEIKNLVFENNTVIDTNPEGFYGAILFLNTEPVEGTLVMRNNIFYLPYSIISPTSRIQFSSTRITYITSRRPRSA